MLSLNLNIEFEYINTYVQTDSEKNPSQAPVLASSNPYYRNLLNIERSAEKK